MKLSPNKRVNIIEKIEMIVLKLIQDIAEKKEPGFSFPSRRNWENILLSQSGVPPTSKNHNNTTISLGSQSSMRNFGNYLHIQK